MQHTYKAFELLATEYTQAKQNTVDAKETFTSVSNELAHTALAIALKGDATDKAQLKESVSKDKPFHSLRGMVSKANSVAFYLLTHEVISLEDGEVTLEAMQSLEDNQLPSVTVNSLYNTIQAASKGDVEAAQRNKAIEKQALAQASLHIGVDVNKKQFAAIPAAKQQAFIEEATAIVDAANAEKAKAKAQETRAESLARILAEITAQGFEAEVMQALTAKPDVKAA